MITAPSRQLSRAEAEFVPPEPSATPPPLDWRHIPRWAKIAVFIAMTIIGAIGIWIEIHTKQ